MPAGKQIGNLEALELIGTGETMLLGKGRQGLSKVVIRELLRCQCLCNQRLTQVGPEQALVGKDGEGLEGQCRHGLAGGGVGQNDYHGRTFVPFSTCYRKPSEAVTGLAQPQPMAST